VVLADASVDGCCHRRVTLFFSIFGVSKMHLKILPNQFSFVNSTCNTLLKWCPTKSILNFYLFQNPKYFSKLH